MIEISFEYWNKLSSQFILISVFLGGFSVALTANLLINQTNTRLYNTILKVATVSSAGFLTAVFAMTDMIMKTTEGYPFEVSPSEIDAPRLIGISGFLIGVLSLITIIGLSGWTKSKGTGIFTTIVGAITLILFFISSM